MLDPHKMRYKTEKRQSVPNEFPSKNFPLNHHMRPAFLQCPTNYNKTKLKHTMFLNNKY